MKREQNGGIFLVSWVIDGGNDGNFDGFFEENLDFHEFLY